MTTERPGTKGNPCPTCGWPFVKADNGGEECMHGVRMDATCDVCDGGPVPHFSAPEPIAPPAGDERHCKWCGLPESESHEGHIFSPYCTEYDDPPSPAIGDEQLCSDLHNIASKYLTVDGRYTGHGHIVIHAINRLRALAAEKASMQTQLDWDRHYIAAANQKISHLAAEKAKVEAKLAEQERGHER